MLIGYIIILLLGVTLFLLIRKYSFWLRLIVTISFILVFSILFTLFIIKIASTPKSGKTFTLEEWKKQ